MSSDVYFYVYEDKERTKLLEQVGVGHLAVLHYFGFDAIAAIDNALRFNPVITKELINRLKTIIRHAHSSSLIDQKLSEEEFINCYGYLGPNGVEWDYITDEDGVEEDLREFMGKYISLGWD
jgi:hypothetical protein